MGIKLTKHKESFVFMKEEILGRNKNCVANKTHSSKELRKRNISTLQECRERMHVKQAF